MSPTSSGCARPASGPAAMPRFTAAASMIISSSETSRVDE
jgi:hypothetical protein